MGTLPDDWCLHHFDHLSPELAATLPDTMARMRELCPVARSDARGGFWVVTRYEDAVSVAQNWEAFSSAHGLAILPSKGVVRNLPVEADPPEQRIFKRLVNPYFTPAAVAAWERPTRDLMTRLIDAFIEDGACEFMEAFARPLPSLAFFGLVIHAPAEDLDRVAHLASRSSTPDAPDARECWTGLYAWIKEFIARRRTSPPRGDVVDAVLNAQVDGRPITEDEIIGTVQLLILGGLETTAGALGLMVVRFCHSPELAALLRGRPELIPAAVQELLRLDGSFVSVGRTAVRDVELGGRRIAEGDKVLIHWASANRDAAEFADPDDFVLDREHNRHLGFGVGPHRCAGSNLARLNLRIALEELLRRLDDIRLRDGADIRYHAGLTRSPLELPITFTPGQKHRNPLCQKREYNFRTLTRGRPHMAERTLLTNARVLTCSGGPDEKPLDGDVLIEGNRVAGVAAGRLGVDPAAARVVDLHGATVLPGLADAHTHISWPLDFEFDHAAVAATPAGKHMLDVAAVTRTFLESGYTLIISAGVTQPLDDVLAKDAIDRGLIPGPRIVPGGAQIAEKGGLGADGGMMDVAADAAELREIVARQCGSGVRALKLFISGDGIVPRYPSDDVYMNDEMLSAAVEEAARHGAFITVHARGSASVAMAARTGVRIIHHACFLDDDALRALEARRGDVWVCPGLHYLYAMVSGHAEPWGMTQRKIDAAGYREEFRAQVDALLTFRESGIPILAGGDFGHQWTHHGSYAAELQRYVELAGMTPVEAIHTATRNAGPAAGLEVGQVREGFLADLLIVDGDPAADVTVLQRRPRAVIKDGKFGYVNPELYP